MVPKDVAPETPPSRGISSRLLTMKFMQRAAATSETPTTPDEPSVKSGTTSSSKRRRFENSPLTGDYHSFDEAAIQAALKEQEATRQAALKLHKTELADTNWVLDGFANSTTAAAPRVVEYVGFSEIDAGGEEDTPNRAQAGRKRVGNYKTREEKQTKEDASPDEDSDSSDESSDDGRDRRASKTSTPHRDDPRRQSSVHRRESAGAAKAKEFRDKRKNQKVNLNTISSVSGNARSGPITSISGGGGGGAGSRSGQFSCHSCGKTGHKAVDCPSRRNGGDKRRSYGRGS
ncbi:hypothetical protein VD0004_g1825 [Verticillium dahliae]|uniref:CCHC-type domain-containing protein n=1 Tax=Verticillium dahliae TaxID=27337 RepID=A0A444S7M7_VERDA|nr:hypothetical protein VD0004_g1825 [Verticillium dahliae]PNH74234.1 hypothetical protein VD0001_g3333 [Verticillium dahliae]RXG49412.1 hypothetical protein VDGE_05763 [Verticillium dahliae]